MRTLLITLALAGTAALAGATPALASVSTTQHLPAAACNAGTMNAHTHIPATTGSGKTTPGHTIAPPPRRVKCPEPTGKGLPALGALDEGRLSDLDHRSPLICPLVPVQRGIAQHRQPD